MHNTGTRSHGSVYNDWYWTRLMKSKEQRPPQTLKRVGDVNSSQTARATLLLREMVIDGHFRPGERIKEIPLVSKLGVSRIPLRLALERLSHEGLIEVRPTRGFVVQQFSTTDIYDAIELRGSLEGTAARLAAERLRDGGDLGPLR